MKEDNRITVMIVSIFLTIIAIVSLIIALSNKNNKYVIMREPKKEPPKTEPVPMGAKQKEDEDISNNT